MLRQGIIVLELIVIAILVVAVLAFIAYPLFTAQDKMPAPTANALDSLIAQRDSTYEAIRDLDFDHQLGKLSTSDYEMLRDKYKARAAQVLVQIDQLAGKDGREARIEEEVARLRRRGTRPANGGSAHGDPIEEQVARLRASKSSAAARCTNCGAPLQPDDQFCSKCGTKI